MPPHLNPQGERKEKKIIENPLSLGDCVVIHVLVAASFSLRFSDM